MACSLCAGTCRFSLVLFLLFRLRRACRFGVGGFFFVFSAVVASLLLLSFVVAPPLCAVGPCVC
jgi:hypothetical protein